MGRLSGKVRNTNMNGSCGLSLGLVASGKAQALIQPLQWIWDYIAGKLIVEEAGGEMVFYEMNKKGDCFPIKKFELKHYNPEKRNLGFIAGNRKIVDYISDRLF